MYIIMYTYTQKLKTIRINKTKTTFLEYFLQIWACEIYLKLTA